MEIEPILTRIDECQAHLGGVSDRKLCLTAGVSEDAIRNWRRAAKNGVDTSPNQRTLQPIAEALGVTLEWLRTGIDSAEGEVTHSPQTISNLRHIPIVQSHAYVPDIKARSERDIVGQFGFDPQLLKDITTARNEDLVIVKMRGSAMQPTIHDSDTIMIDTTQTDVRHSGVFALEYGDVFEVRRIEMNPANQLYRIRVESSDTNFFEVPAQDIKVFGRVVWVGRRI